MSEAPELIIKCVKKNFKFKYWNLAKPRIFVSPEGFEHTKLEGSICKNDFRNAKNM